MNRLLLASASPRRRELLAALGVPFEVRAADVPEPLIEGVPAAGQAEALALAKARAAVAAGGMEQHPGHRVVIGADTVVVLNGVPLGKPRDADQARRMLRALRGRAHEVVTGVAVMAAHSGTACAAHAVTRVHMRAYTAAEMAAYIAGGDPFDKAGAYAIQHAGFRPVARIEGCYCNVMGLPLWTVRGLLAQMAPAVETQRPDRSYERCAACPLAPGTLRGGRTEVDRQPPGAGSAGGA